MEKIAAQTGKYEMKEKSELEKTLHNEYETVRREHEQKHYFHHHKEVIIGLMLVALTFGFLIISNVNSITGYVIFEQEEEYVVQVHQVITGMSLINFNVYEEEAISSIKINGYALLDSYTKILLINNEETLTVWEQGESEMYLQEACKDTCSMKKSTSNHLLITTDKEIYIESITYTK